MAHETHQEAHGQQEKRSVVSLRSSFWFVIIIVFLFIAAVNFVGAMKNSREESKEIGAPQRKSMSHTSSPAIITPPTSGETRDTSRNK